MAICSECGCSFDLSSTKRSISHQFGAGIYDSYYPDGDVCRDCAIEIISADYATGAEIAELMGDSWDDD